MGKFSWRRAAGRHWLPAIAAAALLAGCGVPSILAEDSPGQGSDGQEPREPPTALHPGLRDCAPTGSDDALTLANADLDAATWSTPEGFTEVTGYFEDNPVEELEWMWVAGSEDLPPNTLNVISVNYYTGLGWNEFADDCEAVPLEAVKERLAQYRGHIGAAELSDPEMIEIDGHPAIHQDLRLEKYDYEGYWLFSSTELLHVYCQWEHAEAETTIRRGCTDLASSITVP